VRAWAELNVPQEPGIRSQIAELLGLERREKLSASAENRVEPPPPPKGQRQMEQTEAAESRAPIDMLITTLERPDDQKERDELLRGPSLQRHSGELPPAPAKLPLFNPRWERALLSALAGVEEPTTEPDLGELIRRLATNRPIAEIPFRFGSSLRQGVRLFLDRGRAMEPFTDDQAQFATAMLRVTGADRVAVHEFEFLPEQTEEDGTNPATSFSAPVIVVSDFGLLPVPGRGRSASVLEWRAWVEGLRQSGCARVIGLLPVVERRWPRELRRALDLLYWDITASVRTIRPRR
jgi:hypothetical protein